MTVLQLNPFHMMCYQFNVLSSFLASSAYNDGNTLDACGECQNARRAFVEPGTANLTPSSICTHCHL